MRDPSAGAALLVWTEALDGLAARAVIYLEAGYGLHLRGPSGTGKTTLAAALADRIGRPVVRPAHDDPAASLIAACGEGATLLIDGPEIAAFAPHLAQALSARRVPLGAAGTTLAVHPSFRAILVTGPAETLPAPLPARIVTIECDGHDRETEIAIAVAHAGLAAGAAARIVDMVRDVRRSREYAERPNLHCSIMLCRLAARLGCAVAADDARFAALVLDVLGARLRHGPDGLPDPRHRQMLVKLIAHFCGERPRAQAVAA